MTDSGSSRRAFPTVGQLWGLAGLLAAVLAIGLIHRLGPLLAPPQARVAPLDPSCNLRAGACQVRFRGGGSVSLGIEPRTLPTVTPLRLEVAVDDIQAGAVEIDFAGLEMNMGYNRARLEAVAPGRYLGHGMLPVCVSRRMTWEASVLIHTPVVILAAPFRFETWR